MITNGDRTSEKEMSEGAYVLLSVESYCGHLQNVNNKLMSDAQYKFYLEI